VYYYDHSSRLISIPVRCTNVPPEDPFVKISAGRSFFRVEDLIHLCNRLIDWGNYDYTHFGAATQENEHQS